MANMDTEEIDLDNVVDVIKFTDKEKSTVCSEQEGDVLTFEPHKQEDHINILKCHAYANRANMVDIETTESLGSADLDKSHSGDNAVKSPTSSNTHVINVSGVNFESVVLQSETQSDNTLANTASDCPDCDDHESCTRFPETSSLAGPPDGVVETRGLSVGRIDKNLTCDNTGLLTCIAEECDASIVCQEEISPTHNSITVRCVQIAQGDYGGTIAIGICRDTYPTRAHPGWLNLSIGLHGDDGNLFLESLKPVTRAPTYAPYIWQPGDVIQCEVTHFGSNGRIRVGGELSLTFYKLEESGKKEVITTVPTADSGHGDTYTMGDSWGMSNKKKKKRKKKNNNKCRDVQFKFIVGLSGQGTQALIENYVPIATVGCNSHVTYRDPDNIVSTKGAWTVDRIGKDISFEDNGLATYTGMYRTAEHRQISFMNFLQPVTPHQRSISIRCVDLGLAQEGEIFLGICPVMYYHQGNTGDLWTGGVPGDRKLSIAYTSSTGHVNIENKGIDSFSASYKWQTGDVIKCEVTDFGDNNRLEVGGKLALRYSLVHDDGSATVIGTVPTDLAIEGDDGEDSDGSRYTLADTLDEHAEKAFGGLIDVSDIEFRFFVWLHREYTQIQVLDYMPLSQKFEMWKPEKMWKVVCDSQGLVKKSIDDGEIGYMGSQPVSTHNTSASITVISIKGTRASQFGFGVWCANQWVVFKNSGAVSEQRKVFAMHRGISRKWQPGDTVRVEVTVLGGRPPLCDGDDYEISFHFNGDEVWRKKFTFTSRTADLPVFLDEECVFGLEIYARDSTIQLADFYPSAYHKELDLWSAVAGTQDVKKVEYLTKLYNDVDFVNSKDHTGRTVLNVACRHGLIDIARVLLSHKDIDVNVTNTKGRYPLDIALENNHMSIVNLLLDKKSPENESTKPAVCQTSIHRAIYWAVVNRNCTLLKLLAPMADVSYTALNWEITAEQLVRVYEVLSNSDRDIIRFLSTISEAFTLSNTKMTNLSLQSLNNFTETLMNKGHIPLFHENDGNYKAAANMYLASVLLNDKEMSELLLVICPNPTMMAIFGASLLKKLNRKAASLDRYTNNHTLIQQLSNHSEYLLKCSVYILDRVSYVWDDSMTRDEVREKRQDGDEIEKNNGEGHQVENDADKKPDRFIILAKSADILGDWRTPLRMIQTHELMEPASSTSVQTIITDVWNGHQVKGQGSCIPFLTCLYPSPKFKFMMNAIGNIIILALFACFILTDFSADSLSWMEIVVLLWYTCYFIEEVQQIVHGTDMPSYQTTTRFKGTLVIWVCNLCKKVGIWIDDFWNKFDLVMFIIFTICIMLRFLVISIDSDMLIWARFLYCILLIAASLRCLHYLYVFEYLGPKVVMIIGMANDLLKFLVLLSMPITCFGVAYSALNNPNSSLSFDLIFGTFSFTAFQMFGELSLDDLVIDDDSSKNRFMVKFLIFIYIVITNAILMNILTASVFNNTLSAEKEKTRVWRFNRIALVQEFHRRSIIPPFVVFRLLGYLITRIKHCRCCLTPSSCPTYSSFVRKTDPWENEDWPDHYMHKLNESEKECTLEYFKLTLPYQNPQTDEEQIQNDIHEMKQEMKTIKEDEVVIQNDIHEMKQEIRTIKEDMKKMAEETKEEIQKMKNETEKHVKEINDKMDEILFLLKNK